MAHFLALLEQYGLLIIFGNVLLEQAGLPLPAYPLLLVTGALAGAGQYSAAGLLLVAILAALIADLGWYYAGRRFGRRIMGKLCKISLSPDSCLKQTESIYLRIGPPALLFCKFIPGFASISSALAGSTGTRLAVFVLFDSLGCAIWAGSAIWLGATFSTAIDELLSQLIEMGKWGAGLVLLGLAVFIALKWWERYRFLRDLRMARISVAQLNELLERGETPIIVDTRAAHLVESGWIPGARFVSLDKVNEFDDADPATPVILYCSCPNEVTAAQVAKLLYQRGFTNVRPLEGGIDAWIAAGYRIDRAAEAEPAAGT
jgi:membrane protein DedA with SNARE-associated domain/rhodanese-related sulfurtransferase